MKICLLLSTFAYDGIKRSVVHYANALHEMGHEVWVGVLHDWPGKVSLRSELKLPSDRLISWDGLGQLRREWAMYQFFKRERFEVVHASTIKMNHLGRWTAKLAGVHCILASEDNLCLKRSWKTRLEDRFLAWWTDGVIMISKAVAKSFLEVEKLSPQKVFTIYYGLPVAEMRRRDLRSPEQLDLKRQELGLSKHPLVLCVARLHFSKSLETLIEAARIIHAKRPEIQFAVAGDGGERLKLERLRDDAGLQKHFHFVGAREDIYEVMQCSEVVVQCSLWEGLGFSLMEAMVFGKPLVGTDVSGINEIIEHNKNGLLVPPKDPQKLADALCAVLENPALQKKMRSEGEKILQEKFNIRCNTEQLLQIYRDRLRSAEFK